MSNWVLAIGVAVLVIAACALLGLCRRFSGSTAGDLNMQSSQISD